MARSGSAPTEPKKLTLAQVEKTLRGKKLAAWKAATPEERRQAVAMLNEDAAREHADAVRRAEEEALQAEMEAAGRRFFKAFWEPVLREQAKGKRRTR